MYGFQRRAVWAEGPHLYKKDGYYYILHAESGTEINHCIVVARSENIWGPYEYCPANPILTHRHLGKKYPVTCVGHADLVDDGNGSWYMVMLACRPENGHTLMGRETFLARVEWEDDWPVVNPGVGKLEDHVEIAGIEKMEESDVQDSSVRYTFEGETLPQQFVLLRGEGKGVYSLADQPGSLRLFMAKTALKDTSTPAYAAVRQQHRVYQAETMVRPCFVSDEDCAGLAVVQSNENHLRMELFERTQTGASEKTMALRVIARRNGADQILQEMVVNPATSVQLKVEVHGLRAAFGWKTDGEWQTAVSNIPLEFLSTESAGGFVGCTVGMYASANGRESNGYADFEWFAYKGL